MILTALLLLALSAGPGFEDAVLFLSGASCIEELDESTLERYRALELRPLELNTASRSRLVSSGLMSAFQAASLLDARARSGDILSYTELGLLDGFSPEYADALRLFTTLSSSSAPGQKPRTGLHHDLMLRGAGRLSGDMAASGGLKYKLTAGERAELGWATRTTYSDPKIGIGTLSAALYGKKHLGKLILGHFNARFGQGLTEWSGFSMSPWSGTGALKRNGTGFSATNSFSPGHCGAAVDFEFGRWTAGAAYSFPDNIGMGALAYTGKRFTAGLTLSGKAVGADFKWGFPGGVVFGECAWNGGPAAVAGVYWVPKYGSKIAALLRFKGGLTEVAAGAGGRDYEALVYWSPQQFRTFAKYARDISIWKFTLTPGIRLAARRKDGWRLEGRGELKATLAPFEAASRLDVVRGKAVSWLFNTEAGLNREKIRFWLRWTLFCVDEWEDRIYVYERDAPGSFNVPAYYGRGQAISLAGAWKPSRKHRFDLRVSYIEYPWNTEEKASKLEVKLQYQLSL